MKKIVMALFLVFLVSGCTITPVPDNLELEPRSDNQATVYVYTYKTGILNSGIDAPFVFDDVQLTKLNTGEYYKFLTNSGKHTFQFHPRGIFSKNVINIELKPSGTYFFRAVGGLTPYVYQIRDPEEIYDTYTKIKAGYYEYSEVD
ncbi:hypothetical protein D5018_15770 [Parashewanella curva]|uniref:DUF2846 domain-containing protein n=1 Tax=Parashewanella curva TaxID=2338552 RepID=A0A3L8PTT6_9GAMM|nr:lipoprotein [Parashewanella curva]RLV58716.1 hypothetical protein D5018_15770 [Parashewanella curva]